MKRILVTGGSGFIGTNLIKRLLDKFIIFNVDRLDYCSVNSNLTEFYQKKNYFFFNSNISNNKTINFILNKYKINYILNLASETHVDRSIDNSKIFIKNNIFSQLEFINTVNIFHKKSNSSLEKFIHISTDEVFGSTLKKKFTENSKYRTNSPYSASKGSVDLILRSYYKTFNLPSVLVHSCNNYGPYQFIDKLIPRTIVHLFERKKIEIYGNGKNIREWIHVSDFCDVIFKLIKHGKIGETYNVGSNYTLDNLSLVKNICEEFDKLFFLKNSKKLISFVKDRPGHDYAYIINSNKLRKEISWQPTINMMIGIKNLISWFSINKKWVISCKKNYNGDRIGLGK